MVSLVDKVQDRRNYLHQLAIAVDQLFNALLAGHADETLSSRAYRCQFDKKRWRIARLMIDGLFFWQDKHCFNSYVNELLRGHLPGHFRSVVPEGNTI